jgi:hypothetical protein
LRGGVGVSIVAASAAVGAIITIAHRAQPGRVLGVCIVVGTVIAALAVRPRAGRLIFPVPVLAYLIGALIAGIAYNRSTSKAELAIGSAQWIANGFLLMALATGLAIVLVTVRWILRPRDRRAPAIPDRSGSADEIALRPRGGPGVPRQPGPQPGQRPPASDGPGQRNGPYPGQGYRQSPEQRPGQGSGQRPGPGHGPYPGQRPAQGNPPYPGQQPGPYPGQGYGPSPDQRPSQGYGQYAGPGPAQRNGSDRDRRYGTYPSPRNAP